MWKLCYSLQNSSKNVLLTLLNITLNFLSITINTAYEPFTPNHDE
jgi:hypothetical protein